MKRSMTRADGLLFLARWKAVNEAEIAELRTASASQKLRQLAALMASVQSLGWEDALAEGEGAVRARWKKLRGTAGG